MIIGVLLPTIWRERRPLPNDWIEVDGVDEENGLPFKGFTSGSA